MQLVRKTGDNKKSRAGQPFFIAGGFHQGPAGAFASRNLRFQLCEHGLNRRMLLKPKLLSVQFVCNRQEYGVKINNNDKKNLHVRHVISAAQYSHCLNCRKI